MQDKINEQYDDMRENHKFIIKIYYRIDTYRDSDETHRNYRMEKFCRTVETAKWCDYYQCDSIIRMILFTDFIENMKMDLLDNAISQDLLAGGDRVSVVIETIVNIRDQDIIVWENLNETRQKAFGRLSPEWQQIRVALDASF